MAFDLGKTHYRTEGAGVPVYLIGSQFMGLEAWDSVIRDLSRFYRVIATEYPNQGRSPTDPEMDHLKKYAAYSHEFLRALDVEPEELIVIGLSFGANVIKSLTIDHGARFRAAVLFGTSSFANSSYIAEVYKTWIRLVQADQLEIASLLMHQKVFSPPYIARRAALVEQTSRGFVESYQSRKEALLALLSGTATYLREVDKTADLSLPFDVHLIGARGDMAMPIHYTREYAAALKAPLHEVDGGHAITAENTPGLLSTLHGILEVYDR